MHPLFDVPVKKKKNKKSKEKMKTSNLLHSGTCLHFHLKQVGSTHQKADGQNLPLSDQIASTMQHANRSFLFFPSKQKKKEQNKTANLKNLERTSNTGNSLETGSAHQQTIAFRFDRGGQINCSRVRLGDHRQIAHLHCAVWSKNGLPTTTEKNTQNTKQFAFCKST
jgi:hypothetical protein